MEYQLNDENNDDDLEKLINQDCGINEMEEQKLTHSIDATDQICQNRVVNYMYPIPNVDLNKCRLNSLLRATLRTLKDT